MCYLDIGLSKVSALDIRNPIYTVACNKFPCIGIVNFPDTFSNGTPEDLSSVREVFDRYGILKKVNILDLVILDR